MDGKATPQLGYLWAAPDPVLIIDADSHIEFVNMSALRLLAYSAPELIGQPVKLVLPELRLPPFGPPVCEQPALRSDGSTLPAEVTVQNDGGTPAMLVVRDLSDRKRAAAAEARLALIIRSSHEAIIARNLDGIITDWNPGATRLYGYRPDEAIGRHGADLVPEHRRVEEETINAAVARGQVLDRHRAVRHRKDGTPIQVSITLSPITENSGEIIGVASISQAVSSEELVDAKIVGILEAAPDAMVVTDAKGFIVLANAQTSRLLGYSRQELVGQPVEMLVPTDLRRAHIVHRTRYVAKPTGRHGEQVTAQRKDGTRVAVDISLSTVHTDDGLLVAAAIRDATGRLAAQAEHDRLRAIAEQERLARRLQQNQRLESLGQLAGGVAHDFNNLLAVIANYAAFVEEAVGDAAGPEPERWGPVARDIEQIRRAADRGITLTHQLLAFGRREVSRPRVISVNSVINDVYRMLGRSLVGHDQGHITLRCKLDDELWPVRADPAQIEQVLVNLAVNGRDAMPGGGTLTFSTENAVFTEHTDEVWPGRYVRIRVADTGAGMPPEVMARAFEPFFTTKPKGEGTGLGLATVHGIITEAAGSIRISSGPQRGTSFTILLPATEEPVRTEREKPVVLREGAGETVLICEDEPAIREAARRILARSGYEVILAEDGMHAIRLARTHSGPLHLVLTDVVMPQVLGKDVAEAIRALRSDVRVLFMSGYARPVLAGSGTLEAGVTLLEKPFSEEGLLLAVREVLDA